MVSQLNNNILSKIDEIISLIENSDIYKKYLLLQNEMQKNKKLMQLINEIKVLEKDYAHKLIKKVELDKKIQELNNYPLYREYRNTLDELNNTFNIIENKINNYFDEKLN